MKQAEHRREHLKRYDLHVHTYFSQCAATRPEEIITAAKKKNLDGVAITDHDTIKGALITKKLGKKAGIDIIIGEEVSTNKGHILLYNVQKEIRKKELHEVLDEAKKQGCIIAVAHPYTFFRRKFLQSITAIRNKIDCIETFNSRIIMPTGNMRAEKLADKLRLGEIAGSDAHYAFEIGTGITKFKGSLENAVKRRKTIIERKSPIKAPVSLVLSLMRKIKKRISNTES